MVKLKDIFLFFFKLGALTFGGGYAMIPIIQAEITSKNWIDEDIFLDYIAISQVSPGMIGINIAALTGYHLRKRLGALIAVLGVMLPSLVVIIVIASLLTNFSDNIYVAKALNGVMLVVVLLLVRAVYEIGKKAILSSFYFIYAVIVFVLVGFLHIPTPIIILSTIILGSINAYIIHKRSLDYE